MRVLLLLSILSACQGEQVATPSTTADSATDSAADASSCAPAPNNFVENPSFEIVRDGKLPGWLESADAIIPRTGGAVHCNAWVELHMPTATTSSPFTWGQEVRFDSPTKKDGKITATAYFKTLDTNLTVNLRVGFLGGQYNETVCTMPADGSWKQCTVEMTIREDTMLTPYVDIENVGVARKVGIDQVTMSLTGP